MNNLSLILMNFSSFYMQLNDVGRLVFIIVLLLFLILIILVITMIFQKNVVDNNLKLIFDDEDKIINNNVDHVEVDINNEKTRNLKSIVDELSKISAADQTDKYEDEQERTAIISYKELLKAANEESMANTVSEPKKQEVFSSVFAPTEIPVYKEPEEIKIVEQTIKKNSIDSDTFLKSLKEFRSNL